MANQTSTDGFNLSSILNDDELQLMDMAMNEGQLYYRLATLFLRVVHVFSSLFNSEQRHI